MNVGESQKHAEEGAPASSSLPRITAVLGTMGIPDPMGASAACDALDYFHAAGFNKVDTAILYQEGKTEATLGEVGMERFRVATKANPWYKEDKTCDFYSPTYGLKPDLVKEQLRTSIKVLGVDSVDLFYLHAPDRNTPLLETLRAVHELGSEGLFREWGLSNYAAWETVDIWHTCKANGWQTPVVYQGVYNAVTRGVERELLSALKKLGMRFYAYNPLAGGILTGKHSFDKPPTEGRFKGSTVWGTRYRQRYWHKPIFDAIDNLKALSEKHDIDLVSASLRWMRHHSALSGDMGDAVIISGSRVSQVKANVDACCDETPLPKDFVDGFDAAWETSKTHCPSYFM